MTFRRGEAPEAACADASVANPADIAVAAVNNETSESWLKFLLLMVIGSCRGGLGGRYNRSLLHVADEEVECRANAFSRHAATRLLAFETMLTANLLI